MREPCVCEFVARLPASQPPVSQYLRRLRQAGLLTERRQKQWTYYAIRGDLPPLLGQIVATLPRNAQDDAWLRGNLVDTVCAAVPAPMGGTWRCGLRQEGECQWMDAKFKELLGVAASIAAGCESCLEYHVGAARREGADSREIQTAVQIARAVRLQAVTKIDDLAAKLDRGEPLRLRVVGDEASGCGCGEGCNC